MLFPLELWLSCISTTLVISVFRHVAKDVQSVVVFLSWFMCVADF